METMTVSNFRKNMTAVLDKVAAGDRIIIRRGAQSFAIISVGDDELAISPKLQAKIDKAREAYSKGETLHFDSKQDMHKWLESL